VAGKGTSCGASLAVARSSQVERAIDLAVASPEHRQLASTSRDTPRGYYLHCKRGCVRTAPRSDISSDNLGCLYWHCQWLWTVCPLPATTRKEEDEEQTYNYTPAYFIIL